MTTFHIFRQLTPSPARGWTRQNRNQLNIWRAACAVLMLCAATSIAAPAQSFTTLWNFEGFAFSPNTPLVQGTDGNFYGVTPRGGTYDLGTIFKITPGDKLTILHVFCSQNFQPRCTDGGFPSGGLVQASDGNLWGTAEIGGAHGDGTVFKITPGGKLTTVYDFCSETSCADGVFPGGELVQGTDGNFYGTTSSGIGGQPGGTIFRLTPSGTKTTLYTFCSQQGCFDGGEPTGLVQATDGNFYGTTHIGGSQMLFCQSVPCGTVFKITPSGTLTTLYRFCSQFPCTDGAGPTRLLQGIDGFLYGTTQGEGTNGAGTVFKISLQGKMTTLHSFVFTDGAFPSALVQATDGNFYGTTSQTLTGFTGTVFQITPGGTVTTLHTFNGSDGASPSAALVQATDGNFYGTTTEGGGRACGGVGCGTVFRLSTGLDPFVSFIRNSGVAGATVQILGQGFIGASDVSFNGIPAAFTVRSDSYLTATVPAGATAGFVSVTTSSSTLMSNKIFRVVPQIKSFTPTSGPIGTSVVITGSGFAGAIHAHFGGVLATSFTVDSDTRITVTVPSGAETGKVSVCTPGENAQSATSFTVTP